jgi:hypothetical protein
MESVEKIADKVVDEARTRTGTHLCLDDDWDDLHRAIAAALAAERAKLETFAAENERLRKALSEVCAELTDHRGGWPHWAEAPGRVQGALNIIRAAVVSDSTKQAAEAAKVKP